MTDASTSWVAILTLHEQINRSKQKERAEPYILSKEEATFIGRSKECHVYLKPKYINTSRYHAKIQRVESNGETQWRIWDLDTPNGTFINDEKIDNYLQLKSGDQITLGKPNGAKLSFEWKAIHLTQINEIFREKPSYDETIVSNIEEIHEHESKTNIVIDEPDLQSSEPPDSQEVTSPPEAIPPEKNSFIEIEGEREDAPRLRKEDDKSSKTLRNVALLSLLTLVLLSFIASILNSNTAQNNRDRTLSAYIENISQLLLDRQLGSLNSFSTDARKARDSANGQTLTTLKELDGQGKGKLLRFLHGAKLIRIQPQELSEEWRTSENLISTRKILLLPPGLMRSNFIYTKGIKPSNAGTTPIPVFIHNALAPSKVFLTGENLSCSNNDKKSTQNKDCAWLMEFKYKSYEKPFLTPVQLSGADLLGTQLENAPLEHINLEGAYLSAQTCDQRASGGQNNLYTKLTGWLNRSNCRADFSGAGLQQARLFRAVLMGADLKNTKLDYADLRQVDLRGANLAGVSWQGALLKGACYLEEDWQKYFPEKGPNGANFDPVAEGMKAIPRQESDTSKPLFFKECKDY